MSTEKSDALVIRQADFSETSRVVTFFSRDFGKLAALAKGAKRLKGQFEAALDLLSTCRIVFIRKSTDSLNLLTEASLVARFRPSGRNLTALYGGYYVAELLDALTEVYDPHPLLFDASCQTLQSLSDRPTSRLAIIRFEFAVLREIGQLPVFDQCVACGALTVRRGPYEYTANQGGLLCRSCQQEQFRRHHIQDGTLAIIKRLIDADSRQSAVRIGLTEQQYGELRKLTSAAISHVMGRRPKTLRYLDGDSSRR